MRGERKPLGLMVHTGKRNRTVRGDRMGTRVHFALLPGNDNVAVFVTRDKGEDVIGYGELTRQAFVDMYEAIVELAIERDAKASC